MIHRWMARIGLAFSAFMLTGHALAQDFPSRPITMVMPYAPGGPGDVITRVFAAAMQNRWGSRLWWTTRRARPARSAPPKSRAPGPMATPC